MSSRRPSPSVRIAGAVSVGDRSLHERLIVEVEASHDLVWNDAAADVLIADESWAGDDTGPEAVVLLAVSSSIELSPRVRALLPPDASERSIISAVRLVAEGLTVLPAGAPDWPVEDQGTEEEDARSAASPTLTLREREVLQLLAAGASNKTIARQMNVSVHTAKFHVASLLRKLGASSRLEAVGVGLKTGLLML